LGGLRRSLPYDLRVRELDELLSDEPAWALVESWIAEAVNDVRVLPTDRGRAEETLRLLQVTTRSPMGSVAFETGGLLIDHGWVRILGAGGEAMNSSLASWNGLRDPRSGVRPLPPPFAREGKPVSQAHRNLVPVAELCGYYRDSPTQRAAGGRDVPRRVHRVAQLKTRTGLAAASITRCGARRTRPTFADHFLAASPLFPCRVTRGAVGADRLLAPKPWMAVIRSSPEATAVIL
jgi:Protein of unknown function DUF2625